VIRETIREMNMVAIGRLVLTSREHIIALEPLKNGLMGTLLRYPYEVRDEGQYFEDIQDVKVTKDMLDLARHIVEQKAAEFNPGKFDDRYETALVELINEKRAGIAIRPHGKERPGTNVVDLMTALKQSLKGETVPAPKKKRVKRATGQREMLLPIAGDKPAAAPKKAAKPASSRTKKAG
jgi:DNA end-binding protein Ku